MDNNFLSVDEFAAAAKTSKQNIYKQLTKRLQPYTKKDSIGRAIISKEALKEFYSNSTPNTTEFNNIEQPIDSGNFNGFSNSDLSTNSTAVEQLEQPIEQPQNVDKIDYTQQYIESLLQQINDLKEEKQQLKDELDKKTAEKDRVIESKDKQIQEYNNTLTEMLKQQQQLTEKALQTTGNAQLLQAADKINEQPQQKKKGLLSHIFKQKEKNTAEE